MNIGLLHRLREADGRFVPLEALGDDPAAVARDLDILTAFGFGLEQRPGLVAYRGPADRLCPDQIEWGLDVELIGRRIAVWSRLSSTSDTAARAASSRSNAGLVVLAEQQTAGRGRRGRSWSAPTGSALLLSTLIFPPESLDGVGWLTALGAVAAAELAERATGRAARIKWPNDVLLDGRKVAGVLVERGRGAVIGIGLNVNASQDDLPDELRGQATSLRIASGQRYDRSELARSLILALDRHYARTLREGPAALEEPWRARLDPIGRAVRLSTRSGPVEGRLVSADLAGGLLVREADGRERVVPHGEVLAFETEPTDGRV